MPCDWHLRTRWGTGLRMWEVHFVQCSVKIEVSKKEETKKEKKNEKKNERKKLKIKNRKKERL